MIHTHTKYRPIIKRHGGKYYLARRLIAHLPGHETYVEPYAGGISVLLNKPPSKREIISDIDTDLIDVYQCIRDNPAKFRAHLPDPKPTREAFQAAFDEAGIHANDDLVRAVRWLTRHRLSRGGLGTDLAWADRQRGKRHPDGETWDLVSSWRSFRESIPAYAERLRGIIIYDQPALNVIIRHDSPDTLCYLDPPYPHETRTAKNTYKHEMSKSDHFDLLFWIGANGRGKFAISGYHNQLYDAMLANWRCIEFNMPNHSGQGRTKQRRTECLWMNYP